MGVKLGLTVSKVRFGSNYSIHRDELISIGFDFSNQGKKHGWDIVKIALETYKKLHGNLSIKRCYVVPSDVDIRVPNTETPTSESTDWPDVLWGLKLGEILRNIKYTGSYNDHRQELIEIGVDYTAKGR
jgi:hypothetical protein